MDEPGADDDGSGSAGSQGGGGGAARSFSLSLARRGLAELPPGLDAALEALDASGNQLTSAGLIAGLPALTTLNLADNHLGPGLGGSLAGLSRLTALSLQRNYLTQLAGELDGCSGLTALELGRNRLVTLDGALPRDGAPRLTSLDLCNALSGSRARELPPELWALTGLAHLDIRFNQLRRLPPEIAALTSLQVLRLGGNRMRELPLAAMAQGMRALRVLDLAPWNRLVEPTSAAAALRAALPALEVRLGEEAAVAGPSREEADSAPAVPGPGQQPPLRWQLGPLSTPTLQDRLASLFGVRMPHDCSRQHRAGVLDALVGCHGARGARTERRVSGVPLPACLADPLLAALRATPWPRPRERAKVTAGEYLTVARPSGEEAAAPAGGGGRHAELWAAAAAVVESLDAPFAAAYTAIAVTKNFVGSPHIDTHDVSYQWALSLGEYGGGGELCVELSPLEVAVIDTRHRAAKVDGRYVHWVRGYDPAAGDRFSVIYYRTQGAPDPKLGAVLLPPLGESLP